MKNKEKLFLALTLSVLSLLSVYSFSEVSAISQPRYLVHPEIFPTFITVIGDKLIAYDPVESSLLFISKEGGLVKSLKAPRDIIDVVASNDKIFFISSANSKLYVYSVSGDDVREIELPGAPSDLDASSRFLSVSLPDEDLIMIFDIVNLNELSRKSIDVNYGLASVSIDKNFVYVVKSDGQTLARIDLEKNQINDLKLDEKITAVKASFSKVLVATSDDKLYRVSGDLKIEKKWSLEKGSTVDIGLYLLPDGRIVYVARSRWVIGEIEGNTITEVRTEGRIFSDVLDGDRIWFTNINTRKVGWVWLSRPPVVESMIVEPQGGGLFKVSAKIKDPDKEPIKAMLIITIKSKIPYLPGDNKTYSMEYLSDKDLYVSEFRLEVGEEAEAYVVAIDPVDNIGSSQKIPIHYAGEETKTTTLVSPPTTSSPSVELTDLYMIASSLLLLIPIVAALLISKIKKKPKKKTRK